MSKETVTVRAGAYVVCNGEHVIDVVLMGTPLGNFIKTSGPNNKDEIVERIIHEQSSDINLFLNIIQHAEYLGEL